LFSRDTTPLQRPRRVSRARGFPRHHEKELGRAEEGKVATHGAFSITSAWATSAERVVSAQVGCYSCQPRLFIGIGANMKLAVNLLVLRCKDLEVTRRFYEKLGLVFLQEKHDSGPQHYAWDNGGFVLELYPAAEGQSSDNVRIGFSIPLLADLAGNLRHTSDVNIVKQPYATADRLVMLLQDPDSRKVEVSQPLHR